MVYQQKLVAAIKCNGKILRERDDNTVYLPFLAEYEIFIKNLESRDAAINISIDGKDVLDGNSLVVRANSSISLEGFLNRNKVTNKFRFIQKTGKVQEQRQDEIDDGFIRIEYRFVKQHQTITTTHYHHNVYWYHPHWCTCPSCQSRIITTVIPFFTTTSGSYPIAASTTTQSRIENANVSYSDSDRLQEVRLGATNAMSCNTNAGSVVNSDVPQFNPFVPQFDEGITVKGSESNQVLDQVYVSPLEDNSYVIVIRLKGYRGSEQVEKPLLVKTKLKCPTCGRKSKSSSKYCPECGTFLN